jgi:hypothetical protein
VVQYLRFIAEVQNGPTARACTYGTAQGAFVQADWDVVKVAGGGERVEVVLPPLHHTHVFINGLEESA